MECDFIPESEWLEMVLGSLIASSPANELI
jgi:hypothetical protein